MQAVLDRFQEALTGTKVRIDGIGQRSFRRRFVRDVRQRVAVHSWKFEKSHANVLIQLADMIAGAIRRSYDESKTDRRVYRGIIANRIVEEWRL